MLTFLPLRSLLCRRGNKVVKAGLGRLIVRNASGNGHLNSTTITTTTIISTPVNSANDPQQATCPAPEPWRAVFPLSRRIHQLPRLLAALSKLKLSSLVVLTTAAGFQLAPHAGDMVLLGWTSLGVALSSFAANSFNQWIEAPFDSQMGRTRTRPLPSHQLTSFGAFHWALGAALTGVSLLASQVGMVPALLAGLNIALYAAVYTPLKRVSIGNTWIGAIVGALPPMIGYIGGGGSLSDMGCWALAGLLYCWQFPHFNSLSWNLRREYSRAGYCMASVLKPRLTVDSAWRHSLAMLPLSWALIYGGICTEYFALTATIINGPLLYYAYRFRRSPERSTARRLFLFSLLHLPLLLLLAILHKRRASESHLSNLPPHQKIVS